MYKIHRFVISQQNGYEFTRDLRLKDARKRRNMSQEALGIAIGLDESVASTRINRYEKGIHQPDFITLAKIAEVLQVPPAYLLADDHLAAWLLAHCAEDENG